MGIYWGGAMPPSTRTQRLAILAGCTALAGVAWFGQPDVTETETSPDIMAPPAGGTPAQECQQGDPCDHDGRLHQCGWETEDGVTEYIEVYIERCGDPRLGGNTPRQHLPVTG